MSVMISLWWKDWKWFRIHYAAIIVQLVAIIFVISGGFYLLLPISSYGADYSMPNEMEIIASHEELSPKDSLLLNQEWKVAIYPHPDLREDFISEFQVYPSLNHNESSLFFERNWTKIEKEFESGELDGIVLIEIWNRTNYEMKYTILDREWIITKNVIPLFGPWSMDQKTDMNRKDSRYAALVQAIIEGTFIRLYKPDYHWHRIHHSVMPLFNYPLVKIFVILGQISTVILLPTMFQMMEQIISERDAHLKAYLTFIGIIRLKYFGAYFIHYYFKFLIFLILLWIPFVIMTMNSLNAAYIIPLCIVYSFVLSSFSVLMSVIWRTKTSAICGTIAILFVAHLGQLHYSDMPSFDNVAGPACLLFPTAYYFYIRAISTQLTIGAPGLQYSSVTSDAPALSFLILDALLMFLIALYFDTIYPNAKILSQKWYFPLTTDYWLPRPADSLYESDQFKNEAYADVKPPTSAEQTTTMKSTTMTENTTKNVPKERLEVLHWDGVCMKRDYNWAINRIELKSYLGEILVLFGPRGCGHEELLLLMSGELVPHYGSVYMTNPFGKEKPRLAFHASQPVLFPHLTVIEMIQFMSKLRCSEPQDVNIMMEELQLLPHMNTPINELSLTQCHLLNLLLAFVGDNDAILLEEPTINCSYMLQKVMRNFILKRKGNRTIVVTTCDPLEAEELGDDIAFISMGHLVALGKLTSLKERYMKTTTIVFWPSADYNDEKLKHIENRLNKFLKPYDMATQYEILPNGSVKFSFPVFMHTKLPAIVNLLQRDKGMEGFKHVEIMRLTIQDAYYTCCSAEVTKEKQFTFKQLSPFYAAARSNGCISIVLAILSLRFKFFYRNWKMMLAGYVIPALCLASLATNIEYYILAEDSVCLDGKYLQSVKGAKIAHNREYPWLPTTKAHYISEIYNHFSTNAWLYDDPPFIAGLFRHQHDHRIETFSHTLLRFGDLMINTLMSNSLVNEYELVNMTGPAKISLCVESLEASRWNSTLLRHISTYKPSTFIPGISQREQSKIALSSSWFLLIIGGVFSIGFAQLSNFPAMLVQDKALWMHYQMGAKPILYWGSIIFFDLVYFLVHCYIFFVPLLLWLAHPATLTMSLPPCIFLYLSFAPIIYMMSLRIGNSTAAYTCSLLISSFCLLPAILPIIAHNYGDRMNETVELMMYFGLLFPPLSATIVVGFASELFYRFDSDIMTVISKLQWQLLASSVHIWTWLFIYLMSSSFAMKKYIHLKGLLSQWYRPAKIEEAEGDTVMAPTLTVGVSNDPSVAQTANQNPTKKETKTTAVSTERRKGGKDRAVSVMAGVKDLPNKTTMMTVSRKSPTEKSNELVGMWSAREPPPGAEPIMQWQSIVVGNYQVEQNINICIFNGQVINLFGDVPTTRSFILDMAAYHTYPRSGEVIISQSASKTGKCIGYVPRDERVCLFLTGRETITFAARLRGYSKVKPLVDYLLEVVELQLIADSKVQEYTSEERRMLMFACAIVDKPLVLLLDEPSMHLSPPKAKLLWSIVHVIRNECATPVMFSSPLVAECEAVSSHTIMLFKGAISLGDTTLEIKKRYECLITLNVTLKPHMKKDVTAAIIINQIENCAQHPHSSPGKASFIIQSTRGRSGKVYAEIENVMKNMGITDFEFETPDLDTIYSANYSSFID